MPQIFSVGARSIFVNTVAWIGIVLGLPFAVSPMARAALGTLWPTFGPGLPVPPVLEQLLNAHLPWLIAGGAALSGLTLAAAVGLLLRLNWARIVFIALALLAILANLGGLWLQHQLVQNVVAQTLTTAVLPAQALNALGGLAVASRVLGALITVGMCCSLAWVIQRLMSGPVRQEFA